MTDRTRRAQSERFPAEMIAHAVPRSLRFARSLRNVEELWAERGVVVNFETGRCIGRLQREIGDGRDS